MSADYTEVARRLQELGYVEIERYVNPSTHTQVVEHLYENGGKPNVFVQVMEGKVQTIGVALPDLEENEVSEFLDTLGNVQIEETE